MFSLVLFLVLGEVVLVDLFAKNLDVYWENYKTYHGKIYDRVDDIFRRIIWEENLVYMTLHNLQYTLGQHSYTLKMNKFGDMTHNEFLKIMLPQQTYNASNYRRLKSKFTSINNLDDLPPTVDWRDKGYVTPVKDQGQCGSCYAFSTTGSVEGQHFNKTGKLVSLSEQNLVDCSSSYGNSGCQGGLMTNAYDYIIDNGGIDTEDSYPYEEVSKDCRYNKESSGASIKGYVQIDPNELELQKAVATVGPISVEIDASHHGFQYYSSGIYNDPQCNPYFGNHAVLVVGYGSQNNQDYWLVKNSWGAKWGMDGYIMMGRNNGNQCGIATVASYPIV